MITLSVGIITRNRKEMLMRCLTSVYESIKNISMEVIVTDNDSIDGTSEMINQEFSEVHLIANKVNMGVAKSRNQIIDRYRGEYLLLLDDDTEILSSNFVDLISYMEKHRNVGVIGCRILTPDKKIYPSARAFPLPRNIFAKRLSFVPSICLGKLLDGYQYAFKEDKKPSVVDFVIGAFQLIKRGAQERVGVLDRIMNYGFQDADFCARMLKCGFLTVYYPDFTIIQHKGVVSDRMAGKYLLYYIRSYTWLYWKHRTLIKKSHPLR